MGLSFRILPRVRLVHAWIDQPIDLTDIRALRVALQADPKFDPHFDQLVECRHTLPLRIQRDEVAAAASSSIYAPSSRRAIVAESDAPFGVARMFQLMQPKGSQVAVFRTTAEALAWLGLDPNALD